MNRKKRKRTVHGREHDVPVAKKVKRHLNASGRREEIAEIRSPRLSHEDLCRLADNIIPKGHGK